MSEWKMFAYQLIFNVLKQILWEKTDGTNLDDLEPEDIAENAVRLIDTSCMVVDCLTKKMSPAILLQLIATSRLSLEPTIESQMLKLKKQKLRREKKTGIKETDITEK